jgi:hypothetical protein
MKTFLKTAIASAALAMSASSFAAISTIIETGLATSPTNGGLYGGLTLANNFDGGGAALGSLSGDFQIVTAGVLNANYLAPLNDLTNFLAVPNSANAGSGAPYVATWSGFGTASKFGMYWGSPDPFNNSIEFLLNGATVGGPISLTTAFPSIAFGSDNNKSSFVTFDPMGAFNQVRFTTSNSAFEMDNFSLQMVSAVPEPGEWAMMVAGLGVVSLIARRRKKQA